MTVAKGFNGNFGYVRSGLLGVHRDPEKWVALKEPPTFTKEIVQIDSRIFTSGAYHQSIERLQGTYNCSGSFVMALHPTEGIEFVKGVLGSVTSTELTGAGTGIYEHEFVGNDSIPMPEGFSFTIDADLKVKYVSGSIITSVEFATEVDGEVLATVNWIGKSIETAAAGTSGTSQGQNAVSFTATLVASTSDQIKLAIDGGAAVEVTIAAGAYTTAALLEAAINTAIKGTSGLLDSEGVPEVACYIDSDNKVNFHTADKGTGAEIAWTAGSNDANTVLGYGTPVEAAGAAALSTASYSTVQPFKSHQLTVKQDSTSICLTSFGLTIDNKLVARKCLGHRYMKEAKFDGKREILLTFAKDYEDETQVDAWVANSDVEFEANFRTATEIVAASGVEYDADLYLKKCRINNSPEPTFNGEGALTQEVEAMSFYEDATYKDCKFDINNDMATIPLD